MSRVPHARRPARSSAAPTSRPQTRTACRRSRACSTRVAEPGSERRDEVARPGRRADRGRSTRPTVLAARSGRARCRTSLDRRGPTRSGASFDPRTAGFGARPEVPAADGPRVPAPRSTPRTGDDARPARWSDHARRDGRAAASTTTSAAASPATRPTSPGWSRTSRRCSTTTRCSPAPTSQAGRRPATPATRRVGRETMDYVLARADRRPRAGSTRPRTPTARASRASTTSGRSPRSASWAATMPTRSSAITA